MNWMQSPLCEKSGIILVLAGLTAGRQSDKISVDLKNIISTDSIVRAFTAFNEGTP